MKIDNQFLFFNTRAAFEEQLKNIKDTSIVFVAEDNIIWTHGVVFGGAGSCLNDYATKAYVDQVVNSIDIPSIHIESEILEDSENPVSSKALWLALKEKSTQPNHIILEQAEYEALAQYEEDTLYFVLEPQGKINWTFGGTFPITFAGGEGIGTFPITLK